jgi:hypothetical protein
MRDGPAFGSLALKKLGSLKFTVIVLLLIALLVVAGTISQAQTGIYAARQRVFDSWIFWLFGVVPLPGMRLAGALFLANLLAALAWRLPRRWSQGGLLLIHAGLLLLVGGGFFIAATAQDSFLTLKEGESSRVSMAAGEWEISMESRGKPGGWAWDVAVADLVPGRARPVAGTGMSVTMEDRLPNCRMTPGAGPEDARFDLLPADADPAENIPGVRLLVRKGRETRRISLWGGEERPAVLDIDGARFAFSLRLKRFALPLEIKLLDFKKTMHPGSDIPRSFASLVEIEAQGVRRQAIISMNRPLRIRSYAFYQSSYGEDPVEGDSSTFAVVRSAGGWLPYAASALLFIGLAWHLLAMLPVWRRRPASGDRS